MSDLAFRLLASLTLLLTVAGMAAEEIGSRRLPQPLQIERARIRTRVIASTGQVPLLYALRIAVVCGYLLSLVALACFVPFSPWAYLVFTVGWSAVTAIDAPQILPRLFVPFYEASLLLNGMLLALCFLSPFAARFGVI